MNLLLFSATQLDGNVLTINDPRQHQHISQVLKATVGDRIRVGQINGDIGYGTIKQQSPTTTHMQVELLEPAPTPLPIKLLLALPRPKMLRRILQTCATLGVAEVKLINSAKVDKSYWQTPHLRPQSIQENLQLGLEQGGLTHLPNITLAKLFKPFVEDQLGHWAANSRRLIAHPNRTGQDRCRAYYVNNTPNTETTTLAIGPEGGFSDYEVEKITAQGFTCYSLGDRILRVETAIPVAVAQLMCM